PDPDSGAVGFEHGGPTRTSRALAMTQIAVFDAANAFRGRFSPYNDVGAAPQGASFDAAVASASYTVQVALYPAQEERLTALLESDLAQLRASAESVELGRELGETAALAILERRLDDGSDHDEPDWGEGGTIAGGGADANGEPVNAGSSEVFKWEPDPLTPPTSGDFNLALGAHWGAVTPFALGSGAQYRIGPPPEPGSPAYLAGWWETHLYGASADTALSQSTPETRFIGNFWGYDATPLLGTPPRLYNQIAVSVAKNEGLDDPVELARYLALINVGLADAGIAAWDSKYYYNYWRPVIGMRRADEAKEDEPPRSRRGGLASRALRAVGALRPRGTAATVENPDWKPVGISVINTEAAITPTPPFPAYPSGHSTFGATTFEIMRSFFGDETRFTFVSEEYNGEGVDPLGVPRPLVPVRFQSLTEAQEQNGKSRIYNGSHWPWDDSSGQELGVNVGRHLLDRGAAFQPVRSGAERQQRGRGDRGRRGSR
ncbi:MAG: vanadium-dependent haloperoxidase, partial [Planctomycetota bacterium]